MGEHYEVTNTSRGPRGFHEVDKTRPTLVAVGETKVLHLEEGEVANLERMIKAGHAEATKTDGSVLAYRDPPPAPVSQIVSAEDERRSARDKEAERMRALAAADAGRETVAEALRQGRGPIEDLDDDDQQQDDDKTAAGTFSPDGKTVTLLDGTTREATEEETAAFLALGHHEEAEEHFGDDEPPVFSVETATDDELHLLIETKTGTKAHPATGRAKLEAKARAALEGAPA